MKLIEEIKREVVLALKSGDKKKVETLRYLLSLLQNEEIRLGEKFDEGAALAVIQKEAKRKQESLEFFKKGKRDDLVEDIEREIEIISVYLPKTLSDEEIKASILKAISKMEAVDFGKVMTAVMPVFKGRVEGEKVVRIVNEILKERNESVN